MGEMPPFDKFNPQRFNSKLVTMHDHRDLERRMMASPEAIPPWPSDWHSRIRRHNVFVHHTEPTTSHALAQLGVVGLRLRP